MELPEPDGQSAPAVHCYPSSDRLDGELPKRAPGWMGSQSRVPGEQAWGQAPHLPAAGGQPLVPAVQQKPNRSLRLPQLQEQSATSRVPCRALEGQQPYEHSLILNAAIHHSRSQNIGIPDEENQMGANLNFPLEAIRQLDASVLSIDSNAPRARQKMNDFQRSHFSRRSTSWDHFQACDRVPAGKGLEKGGKEPLPEPPDGRPLGKRTPRLARDRRK